MLLSPYEGNPSGTGGFSLKGAVTRNRAALVQVPAKTNAAGVE